MLEGLGFKAPRCHLASHSFGAKVPASAVLAGVRSEIALVDELERPTHSRRRFTVGY